MAIKDLHTLHENEKGEAYFLKKRKSHWDDLKYSFQVALEFIKAFKTFRFLERACVTVYGSARFSESHRYYVKSRELGKKLAENGLIVMTGAGPGVMEAANRGAKEAGGFSIGANIVLPHEQKENPYLDRFMTFSHFFIRKSILLKYSLAYIILPGGFGTLDELTEAVTLIQTGKLYNFPVILIGTDYWGGFMKWVEDVLVKEGAVNKEDLSILTVTDDLDEAIAIIKKTYSALGLDVQSISTSQANKLGAKIK